MGKLKARRSAYGLITLPTVIALVLVSLTSGCSGGIDNIFPSLNFYGGQANCTQVPGACLADNSSHAVHTLRIAGVTLTGTQNALAHIGVSTDVSITYHNGSPDPEYSAGDNAETDVIYDIEDGTGGTDLAYQYCEDVDNAPTKRCDQSYIIYRYQFICVTYGTPTCLSSSLWKGIACHETGHSLGLLHGPHSTPAISGQDPVIGCLQSRVSGLPTSLGALNTGHLNGVY